MLTTADVRGHSSKQSCWVIIDGKAYDVTDFLDHHPGGANTILRYAGKDATAEYDPVHPEGTLDKHLPRDKHLGPVESSGEDEAEMKWTTQTTEREKSLSSAQEPLSVLQNLDDFETEAQKILPEKSWIYYSSATDTSSSHINNRAAFNKVYLRPRVLRNVARVSLQRTIMGFRSSLPIFIAPAALAKLGHPEGELCLTRGAARYNIPHCPSTYSSIGHATLVDCLKAEQDAAGAERGTLFFQLYTPINKREGALKLIAEAKRLHFSALVVTVDSAVIGKREDDERYKARLDQESGIVFQANSSPDPDPTVDKPVPRGAHSSTLEWDDLVWIREAWGSTKPIILKGIATVEDVAEAARRGIDGVYLSNHGGRQLDYAPSSLHTLMEIRLYQPQLFDKIEIYVDGGFRRGTDVIKALCLGARAVGLGRPFMYSLTGYGTDGVCRAIEMLSDEIQTSMRLMGVTSVDQLDMSYVNASLLQMEVYGIANPFRNTHLRSQL